MHQAHDLCNQQSATTGVRTAAGRTLAIMTWLSVEEVRLAVLAASAPCARRNLPWKLETEMPCSISRRFCRSLPFINEGPGNAGIRVSFDVLPPGSRAQSPQCRVLLVVGMRRTPIRLNYSVDTSKHRGRCVEGNRRSISRIFVEADYSTGSDTDLVKPSNAPLSLAQLLSPCFAFLPRPSLYDPSLYDYHILGSSPYADEEREGSHSSEERVVTVHCGEGHRGTHRPVVCQVEGVSPANQERRTQTWFTSKGS